MERRSTDLLARYGGEEFIFLLPTNTAAGATHIGETIRLDIEKLHEQQETCLKRKVTVSIGCAAVVPGPGLSSKMLIGASDQALYRAKQNGRNCVEVGKVNMPSQRYQETDTQPISGCD
jgi:diguanylate cyclase (GGDEF)-like protein